MRNHGGGVGEYWCNVEPLQSHQSDRYIADNGFSLAWGPVFVGLAQERHFDTKMACHQVDESRQGTFLFCITLVGKSQNPQDKILST